MPAFAGMSGEVKTCWTKSKSGSPPPATHTDPVMTEIVRNGLIAVTEEMKTNLMRTAYNMIIYEALDFTVGLFDADGNTVSIGLGLPMFIRGMSDTVKAKIAHFGTRHRARRYPADQRRLHHRQPSQPHDLHGAGLPRGRTGRRSPAAWRTGRMSAARSTARPRTSIPKACRCRSSRCTARATSTTSWSRSSAPMCGCPSAPWATSAPRSRR